MLNRHHWHDRTATGNSERAEAGLAQSGIPTSYMNFQTVDRHIALTAGSVADKIEAIRDGAPFVMESSPWPSLPTIPVLDNVSELPTPLTLTVPTLPAMAPIKPTLPVTAPPLMMVSVPLSPLAEPR